MIRAINPYQFLNNDLFLYKLSVETLKLFESLLNLPHEPVLKNLVLRNLEDRAYFLPPVATNGELSKEESSSTSEEAVMADRAKINGTHSPEQQSKDDGFLDKQRIEKMVNG